MKLDIKDNTAARSHSCQLRMWLEAWYQEKFPKVNCQRLEENASGDCRSPCRILRTSRTRLCKNG